MSSLYNSASGVPTSGFIKLSNFYGKSSAPQYQTGQQYPPAAMTANTTTFTGLSYGNGTYTASGYTPIFGTANDFFYAFDRSASTNSAPNGSYVNGVWNGTSTTFTGAGTYAGAWIRIDLPYVIKVAQIGITPQTSTNGPQNVSLLGSNDGTTWTVLLTSTGTNTYTGSQNAMNALVLNVSTSNTYSSYVLVWTSITQKTGTYLGRLAEFYLMT
jgi:hypothetical protein